MRGKWAVTSAVDSQALACPLLEYSLTPHCVARASARPPNRWLFP